MHRYLEAHKVDKGKTAEAVLKKLGWPPKTHQKLLRMPYNKEFAKVSATPSTKLAKASQIVVPIFLPNKLADFEKRVVNLQKGFEANKKKFSEVNKRFESLLGPHLYHEEKMEKAFFDAKAAVKSYQEDRLKLYKQCVEAAAVCPKAKIGMEMAETELKKAQKALAVADKKWKDWGNKKYDYDGGKTFKETGKQLNKAYDEENLAKKKVESAKAELKELKRLMP